MKKSEEIKFMKDMMKSCYTYGGMEKGSYYYDKYILPYREKLGEETFEKVYEEYSKELLTFEVETSVYTDGEGVTYNSLKKKK